MVQPGGEYRIGVGLFQGPGGRRVQVQGASWLRITRPEGSPINLPLDHDEGQPAVLPCAVLYQVGLCHLQGVLCCAVVRLCHSVVDTRIRPHIFLRADHATLMCKMMWLKGPMTTGLLNQSQVRNQCNTLAEQHLPVSLVQHFVCFSCRL